MSTLKRWLYRKALVARDPQWRIVSAAFWGVLEIHGWGVGVLALQIGVKQLKQKLTKGKVNGKRRN